MQQGSPKHKKNSSTHSNKSAQANYMTLKELKGSKVAFAHKNSVIDPSTSKKFGQVVKP